MRWLGWGLGGGVLGLKTRAALRSKWLTIGGIKLNGLSLTLTYFDGDTSGNPGGSVPFPFDKPCIRQKEGFDGT